MLKIKTLSLLFQRFCSDSTVIFEVDSEDPDILMLTCMVGDVIAWRRFRRIVKNVPQTQAAEKKVVHRKFSCPAMPL